MFYSNAEDDSNASMESRAVTSEKKREEKKPKSDRERNKEWNPKLITREKNSKNCLVWVHQRKYNYLYDARLPRRERERERERCPRFRASRASLERSER